MNNESNCINDNDHMNNDDDVVDDDDDDVVIRLLPSQQCMNTIDARSQ